MSRKKLILAGFGKAGEKVEEKEESFFLTGKGTDLGCALLVQEEIEKPALLEVEVKGEIKKEKPWSRLRIEIFDKSNQQIPATSFEDDYLISDLSPEHFKRFSFPILGIVKRPQKVQVMVVGPSETKLEIKNVHLR